MLDIEDRAMLHENLAAIAENLEGIYKINNISRVLGFGGLWRIVS
ncbi:MAG: hypothetical protein AB4426_26755 [Xenococcaceae cyanobacterium]